jgi:hypothetical protein
MNYRFAWKSFDVATGETTGMFEQTIYGKTLTDAVCNFSTMHGDLWEDQNGEALEILNIKEDRE